MKLHKVFSLEEPASAELFHAWFRLARRGDAFEYHRGLLARDRAAGISRLAVQAQLACDELAGVVFSAAVKGRVCLVQRRIAPHVCAYIAVVMETQPAAPLPPRSAGWQA